MSKAIRFTLVEKGEAEQLVGVHYSRDAGLAAAVSRALEQGGKHMRLSFAAPDKFTLEAYIDEQTKEAVTALEFARESSTEPKRRGAPTKLPGWAQCVGAIFFPAALGLNAEGAPKFKIDRKAAFSEFYICDGQKAVWISSALQLKREGIEHDLALHLAERERERAPIGSYLCWAQYGQPLRAVYRRS